VYSAHDEQHNDALVLHRVNGNRCRFEPCRGRPSTTRRYSRG
jgi:hypothetical protein